MTNITCEVLINYVDSNRQGLKSLTTRYTVICLSAIIVIAGSGGSLLVMAAVLRKEAMRTSRNLFIVNLAVSDFLMCTVTTPFTVFGVLDNDYIFGRIICHFIPTLQTVNIMVSTFSITGISLDRFLVIIFPTNLRLQRMALLISFASVWLLSVALAIPMTFAMNYSNFLDVIRGNRASLAHTVINCSLENIMHRCAEQWVSKDAQQTYTLVMFLVQYCVPLFTLLIVYAKIIWRLRQRVAFNTSALAQRRREAESHQRRNVFLVLLIVSLFAIEWLPINIFLLLQQFNEDVFEKETFIYCYIMATLSAGINPILYGVFNENFKQEFIQILRLDKLMKKVRKCKSRKKGYAKTHNVVQKTKSNPIPESSRPLMEAVDRKSHSVIGRKPNEVPEEAPEVQLPTINESPENPVLDEPIEEDGDTIYL